MCVSPVMSHNLLWSTLRGLTVVSTKTITAFGTFEFSVQQFYRSRVLNDLNVQAQAFKERAVVTAGHGHGQMWIRL
jgi:hypothetical protein